METYSEDNVFAQKIKEYIGQKLKYVDLPTGKDKEGILEGIRLDYESQSLVALFKRSNRVYQFFLESKRVPLRLVLLPTLTESGETNWSHVKMSTRSTQPSSSTGSRRPQTRTTFQYDKHIYYVTSRNDFKAGEEVVWNKYSTDDQPCLGNVVVTAEREDVINHLDFQEIAIVQFEFRPTSQTGRTVPGYFAYLVGVENTFVVPLKELYTLLEWFSFKETEEEDDWTVVKSRKKGNRSQGIPEEKGVFKQKGEDYMSDFQRSIDDKPHGSKKPKPSESFKEGRSSKPVNGSFHNNEQFESFISNGNDEWQFGINKPEFFKTYQKSNGNEMGVQGNRNSCYMDSSLFALFAFNETLDNYLLQLRSDNPNSVESKVKRVLRDYIIFPMRHRPFVPHSHVFKLREIMSNTVRDDYLSRYMDVEEFLTDLFKLTGIPYFLNYDNDEGDYIHQITLPFTWEENQYQPYLTLQHLLENSLDTFDVKLTKRPEGAFIVKLPISDGVLIPSRGVIPNLTLNLSKMLTEPETTTEHNKTMTLHAVICLKRNHFVVFVRPENYDDVPWVFMDSNPTSQEPYVSLLPEVDSQIVKAEREVESKEPLQKLDYEPTCEKFALFRNAYICIYV